MAKFAGAGYRPKQSYKKSGAGGVAGGKLTTIVPHDNPTILHAPGECVHCDKFPEWQKYREISGINYTGQHKATLAPCPSTHLKGKGAFNPSSVKSFEEASPAGWDCNKTMGQVNPIDWNTVAKNTIAEQVVLKPSYGIHAVKKSEYALPVTEWIIKDWNLQTVTDAEYYSQYKAPVEEDGDAIIIELD